MTILFVMRSTIYVRNFESTLRMLAERGHDVRVVAAPHSALDPASLWARPAGCPGITHVLPPAGPVDGWALLSEELRRGVDYLRYQRPEYRNAGKLRRRATRNAPRFILNATRRPLARSAVGIASIGRALRLVDNALPVNPAVLEFVREQNPDLLIVTPLVESGSPQSQYVRAARALGIRTALCVYSWDNLTNKGLIQDRMDLVTVWNEPMKREAVHLHGVPSRRVVVTGAPAFDHWFNWKPRWTREEFCRRVGLPASRPYLLYLCSSRFIAPQEVPFVRQWIARIRSASPVLAKTPVLVRPHPQYLEPWRGVDFAGLEAVSVWPREGANPVDADSRSEYYDSIFHSAGVVGVNTSAQIESAIVGREVFTLLAPEFRDTQEGTLHFHHLRDVSGGLLHVAHTIDDHVKQLEGAVTSHGPGEGRCRPFVEAFVRPFGIDVPATPKLVAAIERVMAQPRRRPQRTPWYAGFVRSRLAPLATSLARVEDRHLRRRLEARAASAQRVPEPGAVSAAAAPPSTRGRQGEQLAAEPKPGERVLEADPQFRQRVVATYDDVRTRVGRMRAAAGVHMRLPELAPLWNATPDMLLRLRHYGALVGGAEWTEYEHVPESALRRFRVHVRELQQEAGDDLRIREAPLLGQFGLLRGSGRYTADSLMYYEILTALKLGAVLGLFRAPPRRPVVWEMGHGWGGFAYQFKTLFPDVTYILSSHPDLFLLSATYLRILFPKAEVRFYGDPPAGDLWRDLGNVDFVFVPDNVAHAVRPAGVDMALDLMALERMTPDARESHVRSAFDLGATYFYSATPTAAGGHAVRAALERYYWLHELPLPRFHKRGSLQPWSPRDRGTPQANEREHTMGWKRLWR